MPPTLHATDHTCSILLDPVEYADRCICKLQQLINCNTESAECIASLHDKNLPTFQVKLRQIKLPCVLTSCLRISSFDLCIQISRVIFIIQ